MTTYNTQQQHSGDNLLHPSIPQSFIDTCILYKHLEPSIAAKQAALEIWCNQTYDDQAKNAEHDTWLEKFSVLANQYDLDLIQEALAVIIQQSAMSDYSNIPLRLPVADNALKVIEGPHNQEFETVSFSQDMLTGDTYIPSILGIYKPSTTAIMGSVGEFATMHADSIQKLKNQMMAAALILPDFLAQKDICKRIDTIHLVLIDTCSKPNVLDKHIWPLKNIDALLHVTGAAEALKNIRNFLTTAAYTLYTRAESKFNIVEKATAPSEQPETITQPQVRVAFLEFQQ